MCEALARHAQCREEDEVDPSVAAAGVRKALAPWSVVTSLCSCVQDISVTLYEGNIMFWEVSGIGYFFPSLYPLGHSCYLPALVFCLLFLSLVSDCCFCF